VQRTPSWGCSLREWGYSCYLPSSGVSGDATARDSRCAAVRGEAEAEAEAIRNRQRTCRDLGGDHAGGCGRGDRVDVLVYGMVS